MGNEIILKSLYKNLGETSAKQVKKRGEIPIQLQFKEEAEKIIAEYGDEYGKMTAKAAECVERLCALQGTKPPAWTKVVTNRGFIRGAF